MRDLLADIKLAKAADRFAKACGASRRHSELAAQYLKEYGDHGSLISGCVRDHFPDDEKNTLRLLAFLVTEYSDAAYAARPARVRHSTIRKLGQLVATRDGAGFYGPQPLRG